MLGQNITTVFTTLITVLGTLGGVVLGVVLSNRFTTRQEKAKRNTAVIEEVYTLVTQILKWVHDVSLDAHSALATKNPKDSLKSTHRDEIDQAQERITTLVNLYLPQVKEVTEKFFLDFVILRDCYIWVFINCSSEKLNQEEAHRRLSNTHRNLSNSSGHLRCSLEKLVR